MKPHNPNSVLGDSWDVEPIVYNDLQPDAEEDDQEESTMQESLPSTPPTATPGGSTKQNKKEPIPPDPIPIGEVSLDTLKDHLENLENLENLECGRSTWTRSRIIA